MDLATRLKNFILSLGLANSEFADRAGIPRPTLSQLLTGRNKSVNDTFIKKIHDAFPTLNIAWLLFNEGDMEIGSNIQISGAQNGVKSAEIDEQIANYQSDIDEISSNLFGNAMMPENSTVLNNKNINQTDRNASANDLKSDASQDSSNGVASVKNMPSEMSLQIEQSRKVSSIMVIYSDNSFEIFKPEIK